jgi:hypothetical protein
MRFQGTSTLLLLGVAHALPKALPEPEPAPQGFGGGLGALAGLFGGGSGGGLASLFGGGSGGGSSFADLTTGGIIPVIGAFMSFAPSLMGGMGIDPKGDMTETLCHVFKTGGSVANLISGFAGSPIGKEPGEECVKDNSGGSGPYKAKILEDSTLPMHTIYVPKNPPAEPLPVIVWANGFCLPAGTMFANFLNEIASYGYMVIANGPIEHGGKLGNTSRTIEVTKSIDWVTTNPAVQKYGNIDTKNIAVAGQSCGGENAV